MDEPKLHDDVLGTGFALYRFCSAELYAPITLPTIPGTTYEVFN